MFSYNSIGLKKFIVIELIKNAHAIFCLHSYHSPVMNDQSALIVLPEAWLQNKFIGCLYNSFTKHFSNGFFAAVYMQLLVNISEMCAGSIESNFQFCGNYFYTVAFYK